MAGEAGGSLDPQGHSRHHRQRLQVGDARSGFTTANAFFACVCVLWGWGGWGTAARYFCAWLRSEDAISFLLRGNLEGTGSVFLPAIDDDVKPLPKAPTVAFAFHAENIRGRRVCCPAVLLWLRARCGAHRKIPRCGAHAPRFNALWIDVLMLGPTRNACCFLRCDASLERYGNALFSTSYQ